MRKGIEKQCKRYGSLQSRKRVENQRAKLVTDSDYGETEVDGEPPVPAQPEQREPLVTPLLEDDQSPVVQHVSPIAGASQQQDILPHNLPDTQPLTLQSTPKPPLPPKPSSLPQEPPALPPKPLYLQPTQPITSLSTQSTQSVSTEDDFLSFKNGKSTDNEPFDPETASQSGMEGQNVFRAKALSVRQSMDKDKTSARVKQTRSKTKRKVEQSNDENEKKRDKIRKQV